MKDRYFGEAAFTLEVTLTIESDGWGTQGPTRESAEQWAREKVMDCFRSTSKYGGNEADDVNVTDCRITDEQFDLAEESELTGDEAVPA